jgi:hypothetical protein
MGHVALADANGKVTRLTDAWNGAQGLAWGPGAKEIWFTATSTGTASGGKGLQYSLWAVRAGGKPRSLYAPPIDLVLEDVSANGSVLLNAIVSRSEIGGLLAGDTRDRDLSTWSDEAAGGISDDGAVFTAVEQSAAGVGIDPFVYYRLRSASAPARRTPFRRMENGSSRRPTSRVRKPSSRFCRPGPASRASCRSDAWSTPSVRNAARFCR